MEKTCLSPAVQTGKRCSDGHTEDLGLWVFPFFVQLPEGKDAIKKQEKGLYTVLDLDTWALLVCSETIILQRK